MLQAPAETKLKSRVITSSTSPIVLAGLQRIIVERRNEYWYRGNFTDPEQLAQMNAEMQPHLAIVHENHGEFSEKILRGILRTNAHCRTLVVTDDSTHWHTKHLLYNGAHGVIQTTASFDQYPKAMKTVLSGFLSVSDDFKQSVLKRIVGKRKPETEYSQPLEALSDREVQILEMHAQGIGVQEAARMLSLSPKTIETYRENIREKLGLIDALELYQVAIHTAARSSD